jgi:ABC-type oligopeptide transport system substrate-binding subunit
LEGLTENRKLEEEKPSMSRILLLGCFLATVVTAQGPAPSADLKQATAETKIPALKKLFEEFAIPHDLVRVNGATEMVPVAPLAIFNRGGNRGLTSAVKLIPIDPKGAPISGGEVFSHQSYEDLALKEITEFLKKQEVPPTPLERLSAGERVLEAVFQFHESEKLAGGRKGPEWAKVRADIMKTLLDIRREQLELRITAGELEPATVLARRLLDAYAASQELDVPATEALAGGLGRLIDKIDADAKLEPERKLALLEQLSNAIRPHKERKIVERAVAKLHDLAGAALHEAEKANERTPPNIEQAQAFYTRAERLWRDHEGLRKFELRVQRPNTILRVGVSRLPELMSPSLAKTDNERRVVDLLFDSLLKPSRDERGLITYAPSLADAPPVVIPLGRGFYLARSATWSDGKPVQSADVRHTVDQIKKDKAGLDSVRWKDFLKEGRFETNSRQVDLLFLRVGVDPLSATTFKIIPEGTAADSVEFAKKPVGNGPYALQGEGPQRIQGRPTLVFRARTNRAAIRFIHFVLTADPIKDFEQGLIDVALDVQPEHIAAWKKRQTDAAQNGPPGLLQKLKLEVPLPTPLAPNRRVYFLSINPETPVLNTLEVRRALAKSIPREKLLGDLRPDLGGQKLHRPLPNLFPPDTWPALEARATKQGDLFDRDGAHSVLSKAITAPTTWKLKLPAGDPALRSAFESWKKDLEALAGPAKLTLELVETGPSDLTYDWYDYPDDTFWLKPLLTRAHVNHRDINKCLDDARDHREFSKIKALTGTVAKHLETEMLVIPLWQLDPLHLIHDSVKTGDVDPQHLFGSIERWTLNR